MFLVLALVACGETEDSGPVVDTTCAFGPTLSITSPTEGEVLAVGVEVTVQAEAASPNDSTVSVVWQVDGLDGDAAGLSDSLGAGETRSWTPSASGTWRLTAQADDACTLNPDYNVAATQVQEEVTVE